MGKMSVPTQIPQWFLASQWAIVRYFAAVDASTRLRLHPAVEDLDTHHKKVLSDDWGVGFSLQWLASRLRYRNIEHGFAVMRDLQRKGIAKFLAKRKKCGPDKCPDFIAYDSRNKIHIIECKGNQQGPDHFEKQLKRGRQQKGNVEFQDESLVAQRLVTAFAFAGSTSRWSSTLRVVDPPPEDGHVYYRIEGESAQPIAQSIMRVVAIRGLLLAGAFDAAAHAFPRETAIREVVRVPSALGEQFVAEDREWFGQSYDLHFPLPITVGTDAIVTGCRARFGVSNSFRTELLKNKPKGDIIDRFLIETDLELALNTEEDDAASVNQVVGEGSGRLAPMSRYASILNGRTFIADWELLVA